MSWPRPAETTTPLTDAFNVAIPPLTGIPGDWIVQGGAVGLLAIVALMVFTGLLVPRRTVRDIEAERDLWRAVALKAMGHTEQLLPAAQITTQVTQALSDATSVSVRRALAGEPAEPERPT